MRTDGIRKLCAELCRRVEAVLPSQKRCVGLPTDVDLLGEKFATRLQAHGWQAAGMLATRGQ